MCNDKLFNESYRRTWQNPETILMNIGLKPGFIFIDVGCGEGFFTIPAARIVGKNGKVYGLDRDEESISILRQKILKAGVGNINLKVGEAEETIFCEDCVDIIFYGIVLHDFYNPRKVLKNAKKMLKSSGILVNLDWKKEAMPLGPPLYRRYSPDKAIELIESEDFNIEKVEDVGLYHYVIIAKP